MGKKKKLCRPESLTWPRVCGGGVRLTFGSGIGGSVTPMLSRYSQFYD